MQNVNELAAVTVPGVEGSSHSDSLSNAETVSLISNLLDTKLNEKFSEFQSKLRKQESTTQREIKKIKTEAKASNAFKFKGNKLQFEFNVGLLDVLNGAIENLNEGDLSSVNSSIKSAISLLEKRNKAIRFADKSPAGWAAVDEYESDDLADDSEDEKRLRKAEKRALEKIKAKKFAKRPSQNSKFVGQLPYNNSGGVKYHNQIPSQPYLQPFRGFHRQPNPTDKCFSCGQRGHWSNQCNLGAKSIPQFQRSATATSSTNTGS